MNKPVVSVLMITYNHEKFIGDAIEGVLMQQTVFPIELIIGEDCSSDNTREIVLEYAEKYPDIIRPLLPESNLGMMKNFIKTMEAAKGKYIALCEGDDYWTDPYKLQKQVDFLETNKEYGICYTDFDSYNQMTKEYKKASYENSLVFRPKDFDDELIYKGYLAPMTWVFRISLLPLLSFSNSTDGSFCMSLDFFKITKVYYLPISTAVYRINVGSASRQGFTPQGYKYYKGVFEVQKRYIDKYNVNDRIRDYVLSDNYILLFKYAINFNDSDFLNETESFFQEKNISIQHLYSICQKLNKYQNFNLKIREYSIVRLLFRLFKINHE